MSWVAAAVGVGTLAYGIYQNEEGKKDAKKGEAKLAFEASKKNKAAEEKQRRLELNAAMSGEMPGETRRKNVIGANTAQRINASKEASTSAANQQAMIAQAVLGQQDEYGKLAAEAEQYREDKRNAAIDGLGDMANIEEGARSRQMAIAEGQIARGEAMKGAGQQNIAGGATSLASTAMSSSGTTNTSERVGHKEKSSSEKQYDYDKKAAERKAKKEANLAKKNTRSKGYKRVSGAPDEEYFNNPKNAY